MPWAHPFSRDSAAEMKSRLSRIGPFWAMFLTVLALGAISAALFLVGLLALGSPQFPHPDKISGSQLLAAREVCRGVSAGVGGVVALVVAYRKQRDTEGRRESDSFAQALKDLDAESVFTRLSAVHSLTGLADRA